MQKFAWRLYLKDVLNSFWGYFQIFICLVVGYYAGYERNISPFDVFLCMSVLVLVFLIIESFIIFLSYFLKRKKPVDVLYNDDLVTKSYVCSGCDSHCISRCDVHPITCLKGRLGNLFDCWKLQ